MAADAGTTLNPASAAPPLDPRAAPVDDTVAYAIRPFRAADWPEARRMLVQGYPCTPPQLWDDGFQRLAAVPPSAGDPTLGVMLEHHGRVVGVALMIPSSRPGGPASAPRVNASSWAITPEARGRALWMARHTMADPATAYTALTPIPSAAKLLQRIGFTPVSHQCILAFTPRLRQAAGADARVLAGAEALAALRDDPLAGALDDHLRLGCLVTALDTGHALVPMVWRPQRRLKLMRTAELLYTPSQATVVDHIGALGRRLLRLGFPMLAFEAHEDLVPEFPCTRLFQRRLARGPYPAKGVDHLYSELVYLHR